MSNMSRKEAHRSFKENQKTEAMWMKGFTFGASLSVTGMSWALGHMVYLYFSVHTVETGPMMLQWLTGLIVSAMTGYASAKMAQKYARRYDNFNGMLPERMRSRNPDTPFWR